MEEQMTDTIKINTELASFMSAHAPIDSTESIVRIPKPDWDALLEIEHLCFDMETLASDMVKHSEYTQGIEYTDSTQADYETACAGFSLLYAKLKYLVEGNNA
jgi:hypothetical protein